MLKAVVFDGDDTLWRTMPLYTSAKTEFARLLSRRIGVRREKAIVTLEKLDRANVQRFGLSRHRFPKSMSEAYVALAAGVGRGVDPILRERVRCIGERVFIRRSANIAGVERVLRMLKCAGVTLVLCSKGDERIQRSRIRDSGLSRFFKKIYIVREKGEKEFRRVLREHRVRPEEACSVGNSVRSDINPALRLGMRAIWVRTETWALEREIPLRTRRLTRAKSPREILRALRIEGHRSNSIGRF